MRTVIAIVLVAVVALAALVVTQAGDDDSTTNATPPTSEGTTTTAPVHAAEFAYGDGECPPATAPATPTREFASAPKRCIEDGVDYRATVETSEGSFTIDLLEDDAPGTVNNFVVLARWGYFDGLTFHRVVPGFVIQGGDPKGDGTGGPGYEIADELPVDVASYVPGAVAMANSGPNTNGSQFFVCISCGGLPTAGYSLFGQLVDGDDTVQKIESLGTGDGPPSTTVTITRVTIQEA
jgi:cyclophilin family peptidyl-prolyl cis-trans isomerase